MCPYCRHCEININVNITRDSGAGISRRNILGQWINDQDKMSRHSLAKQYVCSGECESVLLTVTRFMEESIQIVY
jgi:hypothetical protein